jgi:tetratricopeptide (TPR) repeat protein
MKRAANIERRNSIPSSVYSTHQVVNISWKIAMQLLVGGVLLLLVTVSIPGCASQQFPVIRPIKKVTKERLNQMRAQEYFLRARDYDRRGLYDLAEKYYEMAYEFDPNSTTLRTILAEHYLKSGNYTRALLVLNRNREIEMLTEEEKRLLSKVYLKSNQFALAAEVLERLENKKSEEVYTLGIIYETVGKSAQALDYFLDYFERNPDNLHAGMKLGHLYIKKGELERAESLFVELEKRFGESAEILNTLGGIKLMEDDTAQALNFFHGAVMVDSTYEDALRNIAKVHIQRENYQEAIKYYEYLYSIGDWGEVYAKTLALLYYYSDSLAHAETLLKKNMIKNMDDFELHYYLGLVFSAQDQYDLARIEFEKTLAINPGFTEALRQLYTIALRENDIDRARSIAKRIIENVPDKASSYRLLGHVFMTEKKYADAERCFEKGVSVDSLDASAWFDLGSARERQQKIDAAARAFRNVLVLRPGDDVAANYLGYMWAEKGLKLDSAKILLEMALKSEPDNGAYLDSYAWIFFQMGKFDSAYTYLKMAIENFDGEDAVIFDHYGDVLRAKKEYTDALEAYEKSLELDAENVDAIREKIREIEEMLRSTEKSPTEKKDDR